MALLLVLLSACSGKAVTPTGSTSDDPPSAADQLPCLGSTGVRTLFGEYETGFAVSDDQVVIAAGDGIRRVPLAGGDSVLLAPASDPSGPLVLNGNAYFTAEHASGDPIGGKQPTAQSIDVVPVAGGDVATALDMSAELIDNTAVDANSLYFSASSESIEKFTPPSATATFALSRGTSVDAVAVYGNYVFVAAQAIAADDSSSGMIARLPKSGGAAETIVSNIGHPWSLVVDGSGLYWTEDPPTGTFGPSHIAHAQLDGSGVTTLLADTGATSLALHAGRLYFSTANTIASIPITGGTPTGIVTGQKSAGALVIAGQNLLWIDPAERALSDPTVPAVLTACIPQ